MCVVSQVTYKTPVPTGDVYFAETFDDGSLDRYSQTNIHHALGNQVHQKCLLLHEYKSL